MQRYIYIYIYMCIYIYIYTDHRIKYAHMQGPSAFNNIQVVLCGVLYIDATVCRCMPAGVSWLTVPDITAGLDKKNMSYCCIVKSI